MSCDSSIKGESNVKTYFEILMGNMSSTVVQYSTLGMYIVRGIT